MLKNWRQKIAIIMFVIYFICFLSFMAFGNHNPNFVQPISNWGNWYFPLALWGAICGTYITKKWGGWSSITGRAVLMFTLGLYANVFGQIAYSYITLFTKFTDYPSVGDIGYFAVIPFYSYGVLLLAQASGIHFRIQSWFKKLQSILIPLVILLIGYFLFLRGYKFDWSNPIKVFLDFGYPLGDALYISLAISVFFLVKDALGGIMRRRVFFILLALAIQFTGDWSFLFISNNNTYVVGSYVDCTYLLSYFVMTLAILDIDIAFDKIRPLLKTQDIGNSLIKLIITVHKELVGAYAIREANKVEGLQVSENLETISTTGDVKNIANRLILLYKGLFGDNSIQFCKQARAELLPEISQDQLPELLK